MHGRIFRSIDEIIQHHGGDGVHQLKEGGQRGFHVAQAVVIQEDGPRACGQADEGDEKPVALCYLREVISEHPAIVVTYFEPDKKKAGGAYKTIEGQLQNIDDYSQCLVMKDGKVVFIRSVLDIQY